MRSASLSGYEDLVRSLGREPRLFLRSVGLSAAALRDPEALIPRDAGRELLEITARATQCEDFALRLAAQRRLSALGPISLVLKEEPTAAHALQTLCRYLQLVNPSLMLHVERAGELVILLPGNFGPGATLSPWALLPVLGALFWAFYACLLYTSDAADE